MLALFLLGIGSPVAAAAPALPVLNDDVDLTKHHAPNGEEGLSARIRVAVPPQVVWAVLTDYDHLSEFVPDLLVSRVIGETEGDRLLYQQGKVRLLFYIFRSAVTLRVHEEPPRKIAFAQATGDFDYFHGSWSLQSMESGAETDLVYTLWAHPKFYVPHWLVELMLKRDIPKRLFALRDRILSSRTGRAAP
jgi:ribosome-associated toxin RatA of RatAB toxin-antitoxin module